MNIIIVVTPQKVPIRSASDKDMNGLLIMRCNQHFLHRQDNSGLGVKLGDGVAVSEPPGSDMISVKSDPKSRCSRGMGLTVGPLTHSCSCRSVCSLSVRGEEDPGCGARRGAAGEAEHRGMQAG